MAAADRRRASCESRGSLQAAGNACGVELGRYSYGTFAARMADRVQSAGEFRRAHIDVQADDVDGLAVPHSGDLDARNHQNIEFRRGILRLRDTAGVIVIGQREKVYASRYCPLDQFRRREHSIGIRGVGMQINAQGVYCWRE